MADIWRVPHTIYLYEGAGQEPLDLGRIADYLGQWFDPKQVQIRPEFVRHHLGLDQPFNEDALGSVAQDLAAARIRDPAEHLKDGGAAFGEAAQERAWLAEGTWPRDVFYDGLLVQRTYLRLLPSREASAQCLHITFTNRLVGTWDQADRRYHARVSIYALPTLISTTGLIEGPAKPRGYYFSLMAGLDEGQVKEDFAGRFVDYGDPRLTDLLKGYVMQAVFYHLCAEPFCQDRLCRLFNAHWQKEMIAAQLGTGHEFCQRHRSLLQRLLEI